jgi:hypothetical protein
MQIQALKDGGCLVIGYQNNMIYVAKLDTSGTVSFITPVSTNSNKLVLYPNPGKDKIYGLTNASRLEVTDINGRVYAYEVINETSDLSNLSAGVYFIIAYSTNNEIRYKGKWVKE